jgi:hypothetical protein
VSADHLIPYRWQPGQSGNPGGRPKGRSFRAIAEAILDSDRLPDGKPIPDGRLVADLLIEALVGHAIGGDSAMMRQLLDRFYGRIPPAQPEAGSRKTLADAIAEAEAALADTQTETNTHDDTPQAPASAPHADDDLADDPEPQP